MGREGRGLALLLAAALALATLSFGLGGRGLLEPSEGRYGSIAAEMTRSGDWLVPRLNGVEHFEKPPLAMWAMALGLELFGESEAALRLPGVLAAVLCVVAAFRMADVQDVRHARWATLLTLASPLFFVLAHAVTTDVYLAACSALSLLGLATSLDERRSPRARALALSGAALAAALGFLVKGPVILVLKEKNLLLLLRNGETVERYDAEVGANALGVKRSQGDRATPEGRYRIVKKKDLGQSVYHRALLLDYPNAEDRRRFAAAKKRGEIPRASAIGGLIEIHGDGGRGQNWTDGCVALRNRDMDELYARVPLGTRVTIVGGDGGDGAFSSLLARVAGEGGS